MRREEAAKGGGLREERGRGRSAEGLTDGGGMRELAGWFPLVVGGGGMSWLAVEFLEGTDLERVAAGYVEVPLPGDLTESSVGSGFAELSMNGTFSVSSGTSLLSGGGPADLAFSVDSVDADCPSSSLTFFMFVPLVPVMPDNSLC